MRTVVLAASGLLITACQEPPPEPAEVVRPVRAVAVEGAENLSRRWFSGRARAGQEVDLSFRVSGPVVERPANVGDVVAEGDLIARIDPTTYVADVNRAQAELARARAEFENAQAQANRTRILAEQGHVSPAALDRDEAAANVARAAVDAQQAALRSANLLMSYTELRAPFGGEIVQTYVENFQDVRAQQPVVRLVDSSRIEIVVNIPENLISYADLVEDVEVIFDPFPDVVVDGEIIEIGTEATPATRTYPVTVLIDPPEGVRILPGMAGRARAKEPPPGIETGDMIVVPDTAIFTRDGRPETLVWVLDREAMAVSARTVTTAGITASGYRVSDGLVAGEWIVTAGAHHLREGQIVRLIEN